MHRVKFYKIKGWGLHMNDTLVFVLLLLNLLSVLLVIVAYTWFRKIIMNNTDMEMKDLKKLLMKPVLLMILCLLIIIILSIIMFTMS